MIGFQSPRSGKFVSDFYKCSTSTYSNGDVFNPLDRGNLYLITRVWDDEFFCWRWEFQSPRSGKFVSNVAQKYTFLNLVLFCFNPLDRGNLYRIAKMQYPDGKKPFW